MSNANIDNSTLNYELQLHLRFGGTRNSETSLIYEF